MLEGANQEITKENNENAYEKPRLESESANDSANLENLLTCVKPNVCKKYDVRQATWRKPRR